jgi:hypothetical protein
MRSRMLECLLEQPAGTKADCTGDPDPGGTGECATTGNYGRGPNNAARR